VVVVVRCAVEQSRARRAIVIAGVASGRTDIVDSGILRQIAAGVIAPRPAVFDTAAMARAVASARGVAEALLVAAAAHHRADAAEQQRAAHHAGGRGGRRSEKRAAASAHRGLRRAVGFVRRPTILPGILGLLHDLAGVPFRAAWQLGRPDIRHRAALRRLPEDGFAHRIEKTAGLLHFVFALQFLDPAVGALQRLVLDQDGLHQRVEGVGGLAQALPDRSPGVRIARRALHLREAVEKIVNQLAFLRCHGVLHCVEARSRCRGGLCRK
jgi:hypothetical protein